MVTILTCVYANPAPPVLSSYASSVMVMAGSGERVIFVHDAPGDESVISGGTIARLRATGARVVVVYRASFAELPAEAQAALGGLDVTEWRMLPQTHGGTEAFPAGAATALADVMRDVHPTAVVLGTSDERLQASAIRAASAEGAPVFVNRSVSPAMGERLTAIDVSDQLEQKLRAITSYPDRWTISGHRVTLPDGSSAQVTGTETYVRLPADVASVARSASSGRLGAAALALIAGVSFGVLGTIAHQATVVLGAVTLPIGLVLALAAVGALLVGLRLVQGDRLIVLVCAVGLLATIFVLSLRSTGGSVLIPEGLPGTLWSVVPTLIAIFVVAWPKLPVSADQAAPVDQGLDWYSAEERNRTP